MYYPTALLKARGRSQLFAQLGQLERAGLPRIDGVLSLIRQHQKPYKPRLEQFYRLLQRGQPWAGAGVRAGLFLPWEGVVIAAAEEGGQLAPLYRRLADHYERRYRRLARLKSRLVLPTAVLVIGVFAAPIPALALGQIDVVDYLYRTVGLLLSFYLLLRVSVDGYRFAVARSRRLPVSVSLVREQQLIDFLALLGLLLAAGVIADRAWREARETVIDSGLHRRLGSGAGALAAGYPLSYALNHHSGLDSDYLAIIATGEAAGRSDGAINDVVRIASERLAHRVDGVMGVLPWVIYGAVLLFVLALQ